MDLILHPVGTEPILSDHYDRAFARATELFIVTAYLTEWNSSLKLNAGCRHLRIVVGKDFGITRKQACKAVMKWLPRNKKPQFLVATGISGFHPKAVFWKEADGKAYSILGSSNLTRAAFETNYEANSYSKLSALDYGNAVSWVRKIESESVPVTTTWLRQYKEAPRSSKTNGSNGDGTPVVGDFSLPRVKHIRRLINYRRKQLIAYERKRSTLMRLFRQRAQNHIGNDQFYKRLTLNWDYTVGNRLQGQGWQILGRWSDFRALSKSFLKIVSSSATQRDDVVVEEIDHLRAKRIATRRAFLSEMLCLRFPDAYPVLNKPIQTYLSKMKFRVPRNTTEGARYLFIARQLRMSLRQNPSHPAKNLAELDTVIQHKYPAKKKKKR